MTHMVIRVIVLAENEEEALREAWTVALEKLGTTSTGGTFDYYEDFTRDGLILFGRDRWGPIPPALQVTTASFPTDDTRGLEQVNLAMESNRWAFKRNMTLMRFIFTKYTDDMLFEERGREHKVEMEGDKLIIGPSDFRICCLAGWGDPGPYVFLYDFNGNGILNPDMLQTVLDYPAKKPLWIVPFDVHF